MPFAVRHTVLGKLLAFLQNHIAKCLCRAFFRLSLCAADSGAKQSGALLLSLFMYTRRVGN